MDELANDHQIHVEAIFEFDNQWQTTSHQQKASCHNLPFGRDIAVPHGWPRVESPLLVVEYLHHYYRGYSQSKLVELHGSVIERHCCDSNNIGFGVGYFLRTKFKGSFRSIFRTSTRSFRFWKLFLGTWKPLAYSIKILGWFYLFEFLFGSWIGSALRVTTETPLIKWSWSRIEIASPEYFDQYFEFPRPIRLDLGERDAEWLTGFLKGNKGKWSKWLRNSNICNSSKLAKIIHQITPR